MNGISPWSIAGLSKQMIGHRLTTKQISINFQNHKFQVGEISHKGFNLTRLAKVTSLKGNCNHIFVVAIFT